MKSLPIPVARARNNLADVLSDAQRGQRIRLTRHGKPVGWIIGAEEREQLVSTRRGKSSRAQKSRR
jgi:prevent-host-death family protein